MQPSASRIIEERDQLQSKKPDDAKGCCTGGLMVAAKLEKQQKIIRAASEAKMAKKPAEIEEESDGDESEDTNAETEDEGDDWKMGVSGAQKALSPEIIRRSSREQRPKPKRATYLLFGSSK